MGRPIDRRGRSSYIFLLVLHALVVLPALATLTAHDNLAALAKARRHSSSGSAFGARAHSRRGVVPVAERERASESYGGEGWTLVERRTVPKGRVGIAGQDMRTQARRLVERDGIFTPVAQISSGVKTSRSGSAPVVEAGDSTMPSVAAATSKTSNGKSSSASSAADQASSFAPISQKSSVLAIATSSAAIAPVSSSSSTLVAGATVTRVLSVTTQTFAAAVVKGKASAVQSSTIQKLEKGDMVQVTELALTSANNSLANGDVVTTTCKVTAVVQDVIGGATTRDTRQDCADTVVRANAITGGSPFFGDPFFGTAEPFFSSSSAQTTSAALASSTSTSSSPATPAESSTTKSTASKKATSSTSASESESSASAVTGNTQGGIGITVQSITQIATSDITVAASSVATSSSLTGALVAGDTKGGIGITVQTISQIATGDITVLASSTATSTSSVASSSAVAESSSSRVSAAADQTVSAEAQTSPSTAAAFVLPGRQLSVLPIGLGVFAGVSVLALIVVGVVTYERRKYRAQFRTRRMAEQVSSAAGFSGAGMYGGTGEGAGRMTEARI